MATGTAAVKFQIKEPKDLSPRIQWLRDYFFRGVDRPWRNEYSAWTTGTTWDVLYDECTFWIVPETYPFLQTFRASYQQIGRPVALPGDFWKRSLPERRAWFIREVMGKYLPQEILPGDLIAGSRFNIQASKCWTKAETGYNDRIIYDKKRGRAFMLWFHNHGYGNAGATSGHIIPDYATPIEKGWKGIYEDLKAKYEALSSKEKKGSKGAQLRAMMTAAEMPREVAARCASACRTLAQTEKNQGRRDELAQMAKNLDRVPWLPAESFWEAIQSLWITHMLIMSDENYPGPGLSFGRLDQYIFPHWERSIKAGMDREFGKEILKCFWVHANTVYDAMIRVGGNQGITAGFGQLFNVSGMGPDGRDMTNDLTYALLEVIDEMTPILEPKPNVRLHRNTPDALMDKVIDMISSSQGAPFLLNFDERSMAGMLREAKRAGVGHLINESNVHDYASVGCLENTMVGNDRSGTVDNNLNLLKAVELALTGGYDLLPTIDMMTGKPEKIRRDGPATGDARRFKTWDEFWRAYVRQTEYIVKKCVELYEVSEALRARLKPTPYLSCMVKGCAESGKDVNQGGAELKFTTIEGVTFGTTVDSLLAIKYLVFDKKECTMEQLIQALRDNWEGHELLQAKAKNRAPKYGRDDNEADEMARRVMDLWTDETWRHTTKSTGRRFRPGMLSWNYWVGDGYIMAASADGRPKGQFLSNAICPSNGADINGPTANANSVGKAMGGKASNGKGDFKEYMSSLPNGASHTITFNPSLLRDPVHREKFKAFLRGYIENGGSALQINMIDADMLREAQRHPQNYRHLLVRVTGYNAYFASIGRELQDEIIARESHNKY